MRYEVCSALHADEGVRACNLWMPQNSQGGEELFFGSVDSSHGQEMSPVHRNSARNS